MKKLRQAPKNGSHSAASSQSKTSAKSDTVAHLPQLVPTPGRPFDPDLHHPACLAIYDREGREAVAQIPLAEDDFTRLLMASLSGGAAALPTFIADAVREKMASSPLAAATAGKAAQQSAPESVPGTDLPAAKSASLADLKPSASSGKSATVADLPTRDSDQVEVRLTLSGDEARRFNLAITKLQSAAVDFVLKAVNAQVNRSLWENSPIFDMETTVRKASAMLQLVSFWNEGTETRGGDDLSPDEKNAEAGAALISQAIAQDLVEQFSLAFDYQAGRTERESRARLESGCEE